MRVTVDCYNCRSAEHSFYLHENGYDMVRCAGCGLLYVRERPDDSSIDQATEIGQHHGEKTLHVDVYYNRSVKPHNKRVLRDFFAGHYDGLTTWLDIGCGHGEFIECVREDSGGAVQVFGSEPNRTKQKSARSRGLEVDYFDLATHERQYDAVSLLNVYSHLSDPYAFIGQVRNVVKPGGLFLIQTGDAAELSARDMLKPLCLPDHLSFVSERILTDMLGRQGFEIVAIRKYPALRATPIQLAKEVAKLVLPGKVSYLRYYLNYRKYAEESMYIMARRTA